MYREILKPEGSLGVGRLFETRKSDNGEWSGRFAEFGEVLAARQGSCTGNVDPRKSTLSRKTRGTGGSSSQNRDRPQRHGVCPRDSFRLELVGA